MLNVVMLTVTARLYRSFDIANALDGHTILIVTVDELIFKLANLVDQDTKLVCNVGNVIVASLPPD